MINPILDKDFLKELDAHREKEVWARITALTVKEEPVEEITGKIVGGNIGIDGSSSVRRTCSLNMITDDIDINGYYWGFKNKFKLEIGLTNKINNKYPDIIWFKQGIFIITQFNTSHTTNNYTISLQGQDKMCLLNGTVGGSITPLTHNFSQMDYVDKTTDSITTIDIPIKEIIYEAVHEYAQEPIEKIIINDLDDEALTLLEYRGAKDKPMWMFIGAEGDNTDIVVNSTINPNTQLYIHEENLGDTKTPITLAEFDANPKYHYNSLINISENSNQPTLVRKIARNGGLKYTIAKIEQGQTVGYRLTDITYPGELIESAGSPVTSVLDKIKNMLGNFEYFYDVDGNFIFQKKKTYVDTSWNTIVGTGNQMYVENAAYSTATEYSFEGNNLISAFSNNPQLSNIRNDYIIWGTKKSVTGNEIPVHLRYAIDKKPYYYKSLTVDANDAVAISREYKDKTPVGTQEGKVYYTKEYIDDENAVDWREIIYQMALDYRKYNHWSSFFVKVDENNRLDKGPLYLGGRTCYQQYYVDLEGFWRQLYNPGILDEVNELKAQIEIMKDANEKSKLENELSHLENEWNLTGPNKYWSKNVTDYPETLNFWFDFLDIDSELAQFAVPVIGNRPKVINDTNVKSIYFKETPNVIFIKTEG